MTGKAHGALALDLPRIQFQTALFAATGSRSRRAFSREFFKKPPALRNQRAQGMPGGRSARSLACKMRKHTSIITTVTPVSPGIPYAMVLTVSFGLSPVTGLSCHRRLRKLFSANLTPASGRQDHTTSPSASGAFVTSASASTASRHPRP